MTTEEKPLKRRPVTWWCAFITRTTAAGLYALVAYVASHWLATGTTGDGSGIFANSLYRAMASAIVNSNPLTRWLNEHLSLAADGLLILALAALVALLYNRPYLRLAIVNLAVGLIAGAVLGLAFFSERILLNGVVLFTLAALLAAASAIEQGARMWRRERRVARESA